MEEKLIEIIDVLVREIADLTAWKENSQQLFSARENYEVENDLQDEIKKILKKSTNQ